MSPRSAPTARPARRRVAGRIPDQHGAWAMLAVPLVVGIVLGGPAPLHLLLAVTWFLGYFAFFTVGRWVKSRCRDRYLPPARAYTLALLPLGALLLALDPALLRWAPAYLPLVAVSLWCSYRRADRSLLNDTVTILAACLMLPVAVGVGSAATGTGIDTGTVWAVTGLVLAYFLGTVPYVKSMIRRRGDLTYRRWSVAFHTLVSVAACVGLSAAGLPVWPSAVLLTVATLRADLVPRWTSASPRQLGIGELVLSVAIAAGLGA